MLKHNFNEFSKSIEKEIKIKQKKALEVLKNTALNFLEEVSAATPVRTGKAKAGHILSKDNPSTFVPEKGKENYDGQIKENLFRAEGILDNISESEKRVNIFVINNVEYFPIIEFGNKNRTPNLVYEKTKIKNRRFYTEEKRKQGL